MVRRTSFWILLSFFHVILLGNHHLVLFTDATRIPAASKVVDYLPGFPGALPFHLQTGYVGVDEGEDVQLFYYFVRSASDHPSTDPLLLWLTGGPGCSAISALMYEIGPIMFEDYQFDGALPRLTLNPYSWTEVANIIFLDLPVGTGFSYARNPAAKSSTGLQSCHQAYEFLQKWLVDHPEFISNPFYVGGDSYVGITLPVIVQMISDGIEMGIKPHINLKGYLLGNGLTFVNERNYQIPFAHCMGLIPNELYKSLKKNCRGQYVKRNESNVLCVKNLEIFDELVSNLNKENILERNCPFDSPRPPNRSVQRRSLDEDVRLTLSNNRHFMTKCVGDRHRIVAFWTNDANVREALHIHNGSIGAWVRCNKSLPYTDKIWDSIPYHANLNTKGYRSLLYSGDHDMLVPSRSTQAWIKSLNIPITDDWRQWHVYNQVAGYTRTYGHNMTFATIKGAGHIAPEYRPMECAAMFKRWVIYQPL